MIPYILFDSKYFLSICFIIFVCLFVSCGGDDDSNDEPGPANHYVYPLSGSVFYEEYIPTDTGLSNEIYTKPVRYANYEIVSENGSLIKIGSLDEDGGYYAERQKGESVYLNIYSDTRFSGIANAYVVDSNDDVYIYTSPLITPDQNINTDITISIENHGEKSGAYNILDVALICSKKMIESTKITHPKLRITWELGNLNKMVFGKIVSSSFYSRSETIPTIYLAGGQETYDKSIDLESETAHFDDMVIAHEIGHFMLDHYSVDASQGGGHNGNNLYPSLSLSEGFATWFAAVCLKNPNYLSTVGLPPKQQLNFSNYNIENIDNISYRCFGIQSEFTVSEILWDIYDGSEDYSIDSDNDGIQINFDDMMHIFQLFRKQKDYPFLITFLDRLKDSDLLNELEISNLLLSPTDHNIEYPYPVVWPFQMGASRLTPRSCTLIFSLIQICYGRLVLLHSMY